MNPEKNIGADKLFYHKGKLIAKGSPEYAAMQEERTAEKAAKRSSSVEVDPELKAEHERKQATERRVASELPGELGVVRTALSNLETAWRNVETYAMYDNLMTFAGKAGSEQDWSAKKAAAEESLRYARVDFNAAERVAKVLAAAGEQVSREGGFASELALEQLKHDQDFALRELEDQAKTVQRLFDLSRQPGMEGVKEAWTANKEKLAEKQLAYEAAKTAAEKLERLRQPRASQRR